MPYFDFFDICEAWDVWAHDWDEYNVITRLRNMRINSIHSPEFYADLTENGQAIYDALNARSEINPNWHREK